jgi:hypothetical protein
MPGPGRAWVPGRGRPGTTLISGQRLDGRKSSVFTRLEEREPQAGMQLIIRRADALTSTTTSQLTSTSASQARVRSSGHGGW